jgi:hypothetical protein
MLVTRVYRGVTDIEDSGTEKKVQMDCLDKKKKGKGKMTISDASLTVVGVCSIAIWEKAQNWKG